MSTIENIRISSEGKDRLIMLKRKTGIQHWSTLCRWAFCLSIADPGKPRNMDIITDSNIEMTWRTFSGAGHEELFENILKMRCIQDGVAMDKDNLAYQFKLHLHRGIGYLALPQKVSDITSFLSIALPDNNK